MTWTPDELRRIYDRTHGKCHICGKKRAFVNYGRIGERGSWSVEHSKAQVNGGSHHGNNLYVACMTCNSRKGSRSTQSARAEHGRTRAPLSKKAKETTRAGNAIAGGGIAAVIGGILAGPPGAIVGGIIGAAFSYDVNPE